VRRALLDTNILLWREASKSPRDDIGKLFYWLDHLGIGKFVHPESLREISRYHDPMVVKSVLVRTETYNTLKTTAPLLPQIEQLALRAQNENTKVDLILLNELANGRVDFLVTEDTGLQRTANSLGLTGVVGIAEFIETAQADEPRLPEYRVPIVQKRLIGTLNFADPFFDSLRATYPQFDLWLHRKADEYAYVLHTPLGLGAFLYLKFEGMEENYADISPPLSPKRRLKIGTFKVSYNGFRVGERLLHIAFDAAIVSNVDEMYLTVLGDDQQRLSSLLAHWGFQEHGTKKSVAGTERVLIRTIFKNDVFRNVFEQYPRVRRSARHFVVPIYPAYHTDLFPDSILNTESPADFSELQPYRNGIAKSYISRSIERDAEAGDSLLFYRTAAEGGSGWHTSVITTLALVEDVVLNIRTFEEFALACRRRSVFTTEELRRHWDFQPANRPFVIHLLHVQSFPRRPNRKTLVDAGLIPRAPPRGLTPISTEQFVETLRMGEVNARLVID
jgi:hypothetical protein